MRLISIGYPLPNVTVDNYNVFTAPSYFDYEAMLIDPESITRLVRQLVVGGEVFEAFDGRPVNNGPSTASAVSASELLKRRADETRRLLEGGGVVVVMARPNAVEPGLIGFEGCDRYSWLPAPEGFSWTSPLLRPAEGRSARMVLDDHPFTGTLRTFREYIRYRAVFDERQPGFREHARTIAVGGANVPIASQFNVLGGTIVFLPLLVDEVGSSRSDMAQTIVDAVRQLLHDAPVQAPYFTQSVVVPGLAAVETELADAERDVASATEHVAAARERQQELASHRGLLWQDGAGFAAAVRRALVMLGFAEMNQPGEPFEVRADDTLAYVEVEASRERVVEWPYVRLQRRLEERLLKRGDQLKGIVVANGFREGDPASREQQFTDALRTACENYRYCLITGETLFAISLAIIEGATPERLEGMRRRILRTNGLLDTAHALGESEETTSTVF